MQEFDPVVLLASLLSVFAVYLISRWLGGYAPARLDSAADALARLQLDYPSFEEQSTLLDADGKSAVLAAAGGGVALVQAIGDRFLTRLLGPGDICALFLEPCPGAGTGQRIRLRLSDFTNTEFTIVLPPEAKGAAWQTRLAAFHASPGDAPHG